MKYYFFKTSVAILMVFLAFQSGAQEKVLRGVVTTFDSIPLHGAAITIKGTKETVFTDSIGIFSVKCGEKDKLKVSAKGFISQSVKIEGKTKFAAVNLRLMPGDRNLEMALGIIRVSDYEKLNALASLNSRDIDFSQYRTVFEAISGRIPGVSIDGGQIIIRGIGSINGPTPALIMVDGMPVSSASLNSMNPSVIKSINVIKDGSSAIYGSKGAFGVVVIETKSGRDK